MFFPAMLAPFFLATVFGSGGPMGWLQRNRYTGARFVLYGLNAAGLAVACLFPLNSDSQMQHYIARHFKQGFECYSIDYDPFVIHNLKATFYRPSQYLIHYIKDFAVQENSLGRRPSGTYFIAYQADTAATGKNRRCVYEALSLRRWLYMRAADVFPALQRILKWDKKVRRLYRIGKDS